jgi:hypothetical protein
MSRFRVRPHLVALAVALAGCAETPSVPDGPPAIAGVVTALGAGTVRIETEPDDPGGSPKALVRLTAATVIQRADGRPAGAEALRVGQAVRAWFTGPVAESYPVQATGSLIVIDADAPPAAP